MPHDLGGGCRKERPGAAAIRRLGCRHRDDEIRVQQCCIERERHPGDLPRGAQAVVDGVVNDDFAAVVAGLARLQEALELRASRAAPEASGDEHRVPVAFDAQPRELVEHRRKGVLPWIPRGAWDRQRRRFDDDRHPSPACDPICEWSAGQRVAQRFGDGTCDVRQRLERGRGPEPDGVVVDGHELHARAGEERESRHVTIVGTGARSSDGVPADALGAGTRIAGLFATARA